MGMIDSAVTIAQVVLFAVVAIVVVGVVFAYYTMNIKKDNKEEKNTVKKVDPNIAKDKITSFLPFDSVEDNMIMMDMGR